jgi:hypothetical protein
MTEHNHQTAPTQFVPTAKRTALVTDTSGLAGGYMLAHLLEQGGWDLSWHRKWWMKRWRKPEKLAAPRTQRFSRRLSGWMGLDPNHRDCAE